MNISPEFIYQIIIGIGGAATVYAAIRADLATLHERTASHQRSIARLHERLDGHLEATHETGR